MAGPQWTQLRFGFPEAGDLQCCVLCSRVFATAFLFAVMVHTTYTLLLRLCRGGPLYYMERKAFSRSNELSHDGWLAGCTGTTLGTQKGIMQLELKKKDRVSLFFSCFSFRRICAAFQSVARLHLVTKNPYRVDVHYFPRALAFFI